MSFIKEVLNSDNTIQIKKFNGEGLELGSDQHEINLDRNSDFIYICVIDLETTGLDCDEDEIIEIAMKLIQVSKTKIEQLKVVDAYESFQDPGIVITEESTRIHGITNDMVQGHQIDWMRVESILNNSQLIVAHNARFDRSFIDKKLELSKDKIWACSVNDIDWEKRNFSSKKQEMLCIWHGFYYDSHRAMIDVDALIFLLTHPSYESHHPILELIHNAKKPMCLIEATHAKYEFKNILKKRRYRWNADNKVWYTFVKNDEIDDERLWLTDNVYNKYFQGKIIEITPKNKYKEY
ncbi:MAG: DNA polymerase III subunit epsilon [Candidatus Marinimicrobia bacterium]|nr:DNA polymerase III subunit epsilon [Candidatus Neomarinimicrobiota bacterium]